MRILNFFLAGLLGLSLSATVDASGQPRELSRAELPAQLERTVLPARRMQPVSDSVQRQRVSAKTANRTKARTDVVGVQQRDEIRAALARMTAARKMRAQLGAAMTETQQTALRSVVERHGKTGMELRLNAATGMPTFVRAGSAPLAVAAGNDDKSRSKAAINFLEGSAALYRLESAGEALTLKRAMSDARGKHHYLFQQHVKGVPVRGAQVLAHFDSAGGLYSMTTRVEAIPADFDTTPLVSADTAAIKTREQFQSVRVTQRAPRLEIRKSAGRYRLAYSVESMVDGIHRWQTVLDANSGRVLSHYLDNREADVAASGTDLGGDVRAFTAWESAGLNYMIDVTTPVLAGDEDPLNVASDSGDTYVFDLANSEGTTILDVTSSDANAGWDSAAVSAIHNGQAAYTYFRDQHGHNGIDNNNANIVLGVHFGVAYENAFWNGTAMIFGDGGATLANLAGCKDVIGHEMSHGVIEATANLVYENQSGALNESLADFFGAMIEGNNWLLGEDCTNVAPGFLRNIANPHEGLDSQPAHMSEFVYMPNTPDTDFGGVHVNSGIPNRAAYLLVEGLTTEGIGNSIGRTKAEALYFRTLSTYLIASSQFIDLRRGMLLSAADLYPADSAVIDAITAAFDAVGIVEGAGGMPDDSSPTDADVLAGDDLLLYLHPDDGAYGDNPGETFKLWAQILDSPFSGYEELNDLQVTAVNVAATKPAAFTSEGGTVLLYVGDDFNLYGVDASGTGQLTTGGFVWSISVSDDGRRVAYTANNAGDNGIYVFDAWTGVETRHELKPVDYQTGDSESGSVVLFADAIDFNYLGDRIVFDALICTPTPGKNCNDADALRFWTIGTLDLNTGAFRYPFKGQGENLDIGFPTFAQNNEYVIAFDLVEYLGDGTIGTATFTYNLETNSIPGDPPVGVNRGVSVPGPEMWGIPTFTGDDDNLVVQVLIDADFGTGYARISTMMVALQDDFSFDFGTPPQRLNHYDAGFPVIHRPVPRNVHNAQLTPSMSIIDFGDLALDEEGSLSLTLTNNSIADITIYAVNVDDANFSHSLNNTRVPRGQSIQANIAFKGSDEAGTHVGNLEIDTGVAQEALVLTMTATVTDPDDDDDAGPDPDDSPGVDPGTDPGGNNGGDGNGNGSGGGGGVLIWLTIVLLGARGLASRIFSRRTIE